MKVCFFFMGSLFGGEGEGGMIGGFTCDDDGDGLDDLRGEWIPLVVDFGLGMIYI
jgi:hypothetical protein